MTSYVLYRIAMTIAIMVFVVLASIYYHFFPLTAIMLIALALLDDVPIMTIAFDNASVPPQPVRWELDRVLVISSVLGLLGVIQSFALLYLGDTLHHPGTSTAANDDVSSNRRRRPSHVVCYARKRPVLETALSKCETLFRHRRDASRGGIHVQSRLAGAGAPVGYHWLRLGLQLRVDDSAGRREAGNVQNCRSRPFMEEILFPATPSFID